MHMSVSCNPTLAAMESSLAAGFVADAALGAPVLYVVKNTFVVISDDEAAEPALRRVRSEGALPLCVETEAGGGNRKTEKFKRRPPCRRFWWML